MALNVNPRFLYTCTTEYIILSNMPLKAQKYF